MKINNHGFWECNDTDSHIFDDILCENIIEFLKEKDCRSVIDIGCGAGEYTKRINEAGILCSGFDGNPNTPQLTNNLCGIKDFSEPQNFVFIYDYALCLEVAEHIPPEFEDVFISNLTSCNQKGIILSWAIPGQGGHGHYNEQSNKYAIDLLTRHGYNFDSKSTDKLREKVACWWFQNTLLIFQKN